MTGKDVIAHWRKRALESLDVARRAHDGGHYSHALFNCHLALEKALKACYMEECMVAAPASHDLVLIAHSLERNWTEDELRFLGELTQYAVVSRYDDPEWAEREATEANSRRWIEQTDQFLTLLHT